MNDLVLFAKALADPTRIRLLAALQQNALCVCELCDALEMSQSSLSSHLQVIRQAGLVRTQRNGKWVIYDLEPEHKPLLATLFDRHQVAFTADRRLARDGQRIAARLALRVDGCCVLGFGQLEKEA